MIARLIRTLPLLALAAAPIACATAQPDDPAFGDAGVDARRDVAGDAPSTCDPSSDGCPPSQHCNAATHKCVDGCRSDLGCTEPTAHCDTATNVCGQCTTNAHCPDGLVCSAHACVPGCSASRPCSAATCCTGACVDLKTNADDCGACGNKCSVENGTATCVSSACAVGDCAAPFADCDKQYVNGCESNLQVDAANCGVCGDKCTLAHATASCAAGVCAVASCDAGFGDCDGKPETGCEADLLHDHLNCGACHTTPAEVCDGVDNDCDGGADEGFACVKGSASRDCSTSCATTGKQSCNSDCSLSGCVPPGELCNLIDDDCNGKCDDLDGCRTAILRSVSIATGEHLFTNNVPESTCCGYTLENPAAFYLYSASQPGTALVYRCDQPSIGRHFITTSSTCEGAGVVDFTIGYMATTATCGAVPLYRLYKASIKDHMFTTDAAERDSALATGYVSEGTVGYVWSSSAGR